MDRAGCAMLAGSCQRFQERRERYRPAGEVIDPARFEVEPIEELTAKRFVERHHYSGSYPAACVRVGLFRRALWHVRDLVGVAVFSVPPQPAAIPRWTGTHAGLELGRLVLLHDVPGNGESWFLGGAFRVLQAQRPNLRAVLSYSDPMVRRTEAGDLVTPGHVGVIYQAHNGRHVGRSQARWLYFDPRGQLVSRRGYDKIRAEADPVKGKGAAGAYAALLAQGAPPRRLSEDGPAYVDRMLREGPWTRVRHPGNLAYVWPIGADRSRTAEGFPPALPYVRKDAGIVDPLAA